MSRVAIIQEGWVRHGEVGPDELAVLCVLALHANRDGECWPTQGLLAKLLGRSRPWVRRVIGQLVEIGLVKKTHRVRDDGGDRACLYKLVSASDMAESNGDTRRHAHDSITDKPESNRDAQQTRVPVIVDLDLKTPDENWQPSDTDLVWALDRFPTADLQASVDRFVSRCRARGYR